MSRSWTKEQRQAIEAEGTNIIVSAGAGSGKTSVLTERVVYFIKEKNYSIDDFLIVTFTNAAAAEMKKRIRRALQKSNPSEAAKVDSAYICTFDSFFLSLVKQYHYELGVSPDLQIMNEYLGTSQKRETLQAIFEKAVSENSSLFTKLVYEDNPNIVPKTLIDYALSLYDALLKTGSYSESSAKLRATLNSAGYEDGVVREAVAKIAPYAETAKDAIDDILAVRPAKDSKSSAKLEAVSGFDISTYDGLLSFVSQLPNKPTISKTPGKDDDLVLPANDYAKAKSEFKDLIAPLPASQAELLKEIAIDKRTTLFFLDYLDELDAQVSSWRKERGLYDFDDIARMALDLVKSKGKAAEVARRFKMVMVDEFQDTSLIQNEFIDLIGGGHLYLVGDVKQSIYLFRAARPDLFNRRYNAYKEGKGGMAIDMNTNFRSRKEVLSAVNAIFGSIMDDSLGGVDYRHGHVIKSGNGMFEDPRCRAEGGSETEVLCYDAHDAKDKTIYREALVIARDIKKKMDPHHPFLVIGKDENGQTVFRPVRYSDFAIIPDRATDFGKILKVFNEEQIPLRLRFDENIIENDLVRVVENLVRLYVKVGQGDFGSYEFRRCLASIYRSFLYRISDQALFDKMQAHVFADDPVVKMLKGIAAKAKDLPDSVVLRLIFEEFQINQKLISIGMLDRNEAYLDAIEDMFVSSIEAGKSLDQIPDMIATIRDIDSKIKVEGSDPGIDSVLLINIHKSKGLEFPITYFAGLYRMFNADDLKASKEQSTPETGFHFGKGDDRENIFSFLASDQKLVSLRSESVRLLYVALTRTREKAYLLNPCKGWSTAPFRFQSVLSDMLDNDKNKAVAKEDLDFLKEMVHLLYPNVDKLFDLEIDDAVGQDGGLRKTIKDIVIKYVPLMTADEDFARAFGTYLDSHKLSFETLFGLFFRGDYQQERLDLVDFPLQKARLEEDSARRQAGLALVYDALGLPLARPLQGELPLSLEDTDVDWAKVAASFKAGEAPLDPFKALSRIPAGTAMPEVKAAALTYLGIPNVDVSRLTRDDFSYRGEMATFLGTPTSDRSSCKSFQQMLQPLLNRGYVKKTIVPVPEEENTSLGQSDLMDENRKKPVILLAKTYSFDRNGAPSYSSELHIDVDPSALRYGTRLHEAMEAMDFKHPDFEGLAPYEKKAVEAFLSSEAAEGIAEADIYPEYGFVDEEGREGSIDLLLVFRDRIRIVDYKASDITKPEYEKQVRGYMDFASKLFSKPAEGYLYSLAKSQCRKL